VREVPKLFQTQLEAAKAAIAGEAVKMRDLGFEPGSLTLPDTAQARRDFEERFREGLLDRKVVVAPLTGSLDELVDRSVAERRPFRSKSQGFRDALIWRSTVELGAEDEVVLITRNWKDFAQDDKHQDVLHHHLREDLEAAGHPLERVRLVPSLEEFIKANVPSADELARAQGRFETDGEWRDELTDKVYNALYALDLEWSDKVTVGETVAAGIDDVAVEDVNVASVAVVDAYEIDEDNVDAIEIRVDATMWFSFTTDIIGAEWLVDEGADVELEQAAETLFQGRTLGRSVVVIFRAEYTFADGVLGDLEKVVASTPTMRSHCRAASQCGACRAARLVETVSPCRHRSSASPRA
jgi:hypothetical protein